MARENADISIVYLPDEQEDAEKTKEAVENEKQSCLLIPGNLMENQTCRDAVDLHVKKYVSSSSYMSSRSEFGMVCGLGVDDDIGVSGTEESTA